MSEPFVGEIRMFAGTFAPRGWALCDGQLLAITQNEALFALLGTIYGGDGRTTFGLPDLRGRVPVHQGTGPGLTPRPIGSRSGSEVVALSASQIPSHSHAVRSATGGNAVTAPGNVFSTDPGGNSAGYNTTANDTMAAEIVGLTGGAAPHSNIQPFLCVHFIIALFGIFPSRS